MKYLLLWEVATPRDPYPLSPEEQKRLSEVKFDFLKNEVKVEKGGYNIRFLPWFFTIFGIALLSKLIEWTVSGFTKITWVYFLGWMCRLCILVTGMMFSILIVNLVWLQGQIDCVHHCKGLIASGDVTSRLWSRSVNDLPTVEPPAMTAAKQPSPRRIATTMRVSSAPSIFGWREVVAMTTRRPPPFWPRFHPSFYFQPFLYWSGLSAIGSDRGWVTCIAKTMGVRCSAHGTKVMVSGQCAFPRYRLGTHGDCFLPPDAGHTRCDLPVGPAFWLALSAITRENKLLQWRLWR